ncbi:MAG: leucine-rich repeat domain-containing protein, partial [Muribaculaceae bacterium]|nr:leucine-rich repeat domain-containing protein [Muribaculaceae bacterium]
TGLASVGGCNGLKYLREVILPEGITSIDNYAFNKCRSLSSINMPESLVEIGEYAFAESGIKSLDLSHVVKLDNFAFNNSRISNIDLSAAEVIGTDVFLNTPLGSVVFGENVRELGNSAFRSANLTGTLVIPSKVTRLNDWVFAYNPGITKIVIPKDVVYIDDDAFQGNRPEAVECNILYPYTQNGFYGTDMSNTILYVPSLTINDYLLSDYWVDFANVEPLPDDLKVLDLDRELTLKSDKGVAEKAELNMYRLDQDNYVGYGHLTVDRSTDLNLSAYSQAAIFAYDYWDSELGIWRYDNCYAGSTIIPESTVTADKVEVKMNLYRNRWYFLSFPFDVNVKDIVVDEDALWVVRKYDGAARANLEENTWQNMADETVLKAGEGYIFNCAVEDRNYVSFIFTPAADGNALFANGVVAKELKEYASDFAHNASWNLVGNTYPAYLNIKAVDFEAPITVWADNTYYAYSPVDDDYVLDPFQAFFVQRQGIEGGNAVKLNPAGRAHSREAAAELDLTQPQTRAAGVNLN